MLSARPLLLAATMAAGLASGVCRAQDFTFTVEYPAELDGTLFFPYQTIRHVSSPPDYLLDFDGVAHGFDEAAVIDALALLPGGDFVFSTQAPLTVGVDTYMPADVVRYHAASGTYSLHLAGASLGLSEEANVDALAWDEVGRLTLSLASPETVGAITFEPGDVAVVTGGSLQMFLSAASVGLDPDVNVIGHHRDADGADLLQFDVPLTLGTLEVGSGDVARWHLGAWSLWFTDPGFPDDGVGRDLSLPCIGPAYSGTVVLAKGPSGTEISWTAGGAALYDVVRGSLGVLRSTAGDFTQALDAILPGTDVCMLNDGAVNAIVDTRPNPASGAGYFYLLRAVAGCSAAGTYDTGLPSQIGSRDAEIAAAANDCP